MLRTSVSVDTLRCSTIAGLFGLKGTMSEAELHLLRARLDGGIRNKAARGELRRGLPVGFVWGEQDGEVLFHPDESVTGAKTQSEVKLSNQTGLC